MEKTFNLVQGDYKKEEDVVVEIRQEETVTNVTSSIFNVGQIKDEIAGYEKQIEQINEKIAELKELLNKSKTIIKNALKK